MQVKEDLTFRVTSVQPWVHIFHSLHGSCLLKEAHCLSDPPIMSAFQHELDLSQPHAIL